MSRPKDLSLTWGHDLDWDHSRPATR
jgi:hypothetical protein